MKRLTPKIVLGALLAGLLFLAFPAGWARAQAQATLSVDRERLSRNDVLQLTLVIQAAGAIRTSNPVINGMGAFRIVNTSSSTRVNVVNSRLELTKEYVYVLAPQEVGAYTIGPATVEAGGETLASGTVRVTVTEEPGFSDQGRGPLFVEMGLSTQEAYPGQEIVYHLAVYHAMQVGNIRVNLPPVEGGVFESLKNAERRVAGKDGSLFGVDEASWSLVFERPGDYRLGPASLDVPVLKPTRLGYVRDTKILQTQEAVVRVRPFPTENRPPDFSGLVGKFEMTAEIIPATVRALESATLTVVFSGTGNVNLMPDPELAPLPGMKAYAGKSRFDKTPTLEGTRGMKTLEWVLVPQEPGAVTIPAVSASYLDPATGRYRLAASQPLAFTVLAGETPAAGAATAPPEGKPAKKAVEVVGSDIQSIREAPDAVARAFPQEPRPWQAAVLLIPALFPLSALLAIRLSKKSAERANLFRVKRARAVFAKAARGLAGEDAAGLIQAFSGFLEARLAREGGTLTANEVEAWLLEAGADRDLAGQVREAYQKLETLVFARGGGPFSDEDRQGLMALAAKVDRAVK